MLKNRVLLVLCAALLFLFYVFYLDYFSYYLLFYAGSVVGLSLLLFLLEAGFVCYEMRMPGGSARTMEPYYFEFYANNRLCLPAVGVRADMEFENQFTGERTKNQIRCLPGLKKRSVRIQQHAAHCGLVVCTLKKVKLFDILGVFAIRRRAGKTAQVLVLPQSILLNSELELEHPLMVQRKTASGGNPYSGYEIREYRPGDSLRNIHWKLSAKLNDYFVKEYNDTKPGTTMVFMSYAKNAAAMDQVVSFFCAFAAQMMEMRQAFSAVYLNREGGALEHYIETSNDLYDFLCTFLSIPFAGVKKDPLTEVDPGISRRLFCVRDDGILDIDRDCLIEGLYL